MNHPRNKPGYMLAEILGAILLVAIAAASIVPGIVNRSGRSAVDSTCSVITDLDRRARIASVAGGPVVLEIDSGMKRLRLTGPSGTIASTPVELDVFLLDRANRSVEQVEFDRLGRSKDYTIYLQTSTQDTTILRFDGFTGRAHREDSPDA